jgi:hypothetical protein
MAFMHPARGKRLVSLSKQKKIEVKAEYSRIRESMECGSNTLQEET